MKMIKKIIVVLSIFFSLTSSGQEQTSSPYSSYGLGEIKYKGTTDVKALGGLGIAGDSININLLNPASYSKIKLISFAVGGTTSFTNIQNNSESDKSKRTSLDYLLVSIPLKKLGVTFGLMPYSSVGYKTNSNLTELDGSERFKTKTGSGNVNKFFTGFAYSVNKNLSFGIDFGYHFGTTENDFTESLYSPIVLQYSTKERNTSKTNGYSINTGIQYSKKISSKLNLLTSFTFSPETKFKNTNDRVIATVTYSNSGSEASFDVSDVVTTKINMINPSKFSFGAGIGEAKKWLIGTDITFINNKKLINRFDMGSAVSFENSTRIAVGGYYVPKYDSFSNYLNRIVYRAGFRYENTGLVINNTSINDYGMNFGLGLPVGLSRINLGVEFGKKGTTSNNLIEENYFNLSVGLSLNDIWFKKRKID